jgi:hypothetical protein
MDPSANKVVDPLNTNAFDVGEIPENRESFPAATVPAVVPTLNNAAPPNDGQVLGAPVIVA